jgi:hypothetical protein
MNFVISFPETKIYMCKMYLKLKLFHKLCNATTTPTNIPCSQLRSCDVLKNILT